MSFSPTIHSVCILLLLYIHVGWANAADFSTWTGVNDTNTWPTDTTEGIPFRSALEIEASVSVQLQQVSSIPAIPIPSDVTSLPEYEIISRLAPALPPIQTGINLPGTEEMMQNVLSSSNQSGTLMGLAGRQDALRVMIIGDSMTQGQEGDWTWRYRIWQWFQTSGTNAQFVGPYKGTVPSHKPKPPQPPSLYGATTDSTPYGTDGGYAKGVDPAFLSNSNHFAVWGRAAAVDKGLIRDVLNSNPADLILLMLGFNDMGWFYSDADGTISSIETLVANARAVNPYLKFAIANVPHRSRIGGRDDLIKNTDKFNSLLPGAISKWRTNKSPIFLVDLAKTYDCHPESCPAGKSWPEVTFPLPCLMILTIR